MNTVYLDNSATTPLSSTAKEAITAAMEQYGNPSSLHPLGQSAHATVEDARRQIAATLGLRGTLSAGQIIFTASGSESDNLAIFGTAYAKPRRRGGRIITTDSEHSAVENAMRALEKDGFEVIRIPTRGGTLDFDAYQAALTPKTFLVSLMAVNNETGAAYDLARAFAMAKALSPDIVTHTDAVQAYLKIKLIPTAIKADLVTVSGHKIHAPKGVGALYVSGEALKRRDIVPQILGGGQEAGFRSGTENVMGIASMGAAAREGHQNLAQNVTRMRELRDYAEQRLALLPLKFHIPTGDRAPHILNFALPDIKSETMIHALSAHGICISGGSACASHGKHLSRALLAFGVPEEEIDCSLRLSLSHYTTKEDIDALADALATEIDRLVKIHR